MESMQRSYTTSCWFHIEIKMINSSGMKLDVVKLHRLYMSLTN